MLTTTDPPQALTTAEVEEVVDLWVEVNDAGGAVGFTAGAARDDVAAVLRSYLPRPVCDVVRLREGEAPQGIGSDASSTPGRLVGLGFVVVPDHPLVGHVAALERVMIHPSRQGRGLGRVLMSALHDAARARGAEQCALDYRGGLGLGAFYAAAGYTEIGRHRGGIRVAPGDDRDRVYLMRTL